MTEGKAIPNSQTFKIVGKNGEPAAMSASVLSSVSAYRAGTPYRCASSAVTYLPGSLLPPDTRLCFQTGAANIQIGYRCGADLSLGRSHDRVLYHHD